MDIIEDALGRFDGGRVLDVATLQGRFAHVMRENLKSYSEIVGIDISEKAIEAATAANEADDVSFAVMDATDMDFDDESFDTVAMSASMHHMPDLEGALSEMHRVLRPGGRLIILEMQRDDPTEPELTSVLLHHWAAEIDEAVGRVHNRTMTRAQIRERLAKLDLEELEEYDVRDLDSDPMEPERLEHMEKAVDTLAERAGAAPESAELAGRADSLRERIRTVGVQTQPLFMVTGVKIRSETE